MSRTAFRMAVLAIAALAVSASIGGTSARAWVPGANGDILYTSPEGHGGVWAGSPHIWVIRPDGTNKRQLTTGNDAWPNGSPDGGKIAFARQSYDGDTYAWRIWEMNANGTGQHPLTPRLAGTDPSRGDNMPRFSPDGKSIAYIETIPSSDPTRPPDAQIWVMNADGSDRQQVTDLAPTHIYAVGWSPDAQHILFIADTLDGSCTSGGCRTFYEMSAAGANLTALPLSTPQHSPDGGYWESFDYAPGRLAWGGATAVWSTESHRSVPDFYKIFTATGTSAVQGTPTAFVGDDPSFAPATSAKLAYVGCAGGAHWHNYSPPPGTTCNYQLQTGGVFGGQHHQLTFDDSNHYSPSWVPALPPSSGLVLKPRPLSWAVLPQAGTHAVIRVRCPLGSAFCDLLAALGSGSGSHYESLTFKAGTDRTVRLTFTGGVRAGAPISIRLKTRLHGHTSVARLTARVLQRAAISARCPTAATQAGAPVSFSGTLRDSAPAGRRVVVVATAPDGRALIVGRTTSAGGRYSATFTPDTPGLWEVQTVWAGDTKHPFTSSSACGVTVPAPPPATTVVSIGCPAKSSLGGGLPITGTLDPAFAGARITLEYSHALKGGATEKVTTTVTTNAKGEYSDGSVVADDIGEWDVTAFYNGDAANQPATSTTCAVAVS